MGRGALLLAGWQDGNCPSDSYLAGAGAGGSEVSNQQVGDGQRQDQHGEQAQQHRAPYPPQILPEVHPGGLAAPESRLLRRGYLDHTVHAGVWRASCR